MVKIALNGGRSIRYVIDKIVDALNGVCSPNYSQDDEDIAFIILQFPYFYSKN